MAGLESDADLESYLQTFGEKVVADGNEIWGIYDSNYLEVLGMAATGPVLAVRTMDVAAATEGITVTICGVAYEVVEIQAGVQFTFLRLKTI